MKGLAEAIAKSSPSPKEAKGEKPQAEKGDGYAEGKDAAAGDVLAAVKSGDKAALASALSDFFDLCT